METQTDQSSGHVSRLSGILSIPFGGEAGWSSWLLGLALLLIVAIFWRRVLGFIKGDE